MQAQHDPGVQRTGPGPHRDRPHLEELRRRPLHQRVPPVPAAGCRPGRRVGPGSTSHRHQPPAVGAQVASGLAGPVPGVQVRHRDRIGGLEPPQRNRAVTGRLPVHRAEHRHLRDRPLHLQGFGHRRVQVIRQRRGRQRGVPGHRGEHPRLDLPQIRADEHVPRLRDHRRTQHRRHVVQPSRRRHPPGRAVAPGPLAAQPPVRAEMRVQPPVTVGRRDPLRLPPLQQGLDQRILVLQFSQPRRPGVRHVDAHLAQQVLDLDRTAQVGDRARGQVPEHDLVPLRPQRKRLGVAAWARPDETGQQFLGQRAVHRQPFVGQLGAEQFDRRLRDGDSSDGRPFGGDLGQLSALERRHLDRQRRPACHPRRAGRPLAVHPRRPQRPVGRYRIIGVVGQIEQIRPRMGRPRMGRPGGSLGQSMQASPHQRRIGPPATEQHAMDRRDIPARREPHPGRPGRGRARPDHPSRARSGVREPQLAGVVAGPGAARRGRHGDARAAGRDGQPHRVATLYARLFQPGREGGPGGRLPPVRTELRHRSDASSSYPWPSAPPSTCPWRCRSRVRCPAAARRGRNPGPRRIRRAWRGSARTPR